MSIVYSTSPLKRNRTRRIQEEFSPWQIDKDLQLWLRADGLGTVLDASGVAITADNTAVKTWSDESGNGNDMVQTTVSKQPTYQTNILNGKPIVRFDGTDDWFITGNTTALDITNGDFTIFSVVTFLVSTNQTYFGKLGFGTRGTVAGWRVACYTNGSAFTSVVDDGAGAGGGYIELANIAKNMGDSHWRVYSYQFSNADEYLRSWTQGLWIEDGAKTLSLSGNSLSNARQASLGAQWSSGISQGQYLNGDIAEVIFFKSILTDEEMHAVQTYLIQKYGLWKDATL